MTNIEDKRIYFWQYVKWLLTLPIPMNYELWSECHRIAEEGENRAINMTNAHSKKE